MCSVRSGLVSLSLVAVVAACSTEPSDEARKEPVRPVKLLTLEKAHTSQERRFPAVVAAAKFSILSFQVSGQVRSLPVTEAQEVEKGALLAKPVNVLPSSTCIGIPTKPREATALPRFTLGLVIATFVSVIGSPVSIKT